MLHKTLENDKVKVQIFKQKNRAKRGFEYYIVIIKRGLFNNWGIDSTYKQLKTITSEKQADTLATFFFDEAAN